MSAYVSLGAQGEGRTLYPMRQNRRAIAILDEECIEGRITGVGGRVVYLTYAVGGHRSWERTMRVPKHRVIVLWEEPPR